MKQLVLSLLILMAQSEIFAQARPFNLGGERRRYTVYLPASYLQQPQKSYPLVFNFHGGGMTMTEQMFYSGMNEAAEKYGFIVVYPQGIRQDWNVGFDMSYQKGTDDIGFTLALLESLGKEFRINKKRVYATGLSRGGFFCQRIAAELSDHFAAVASVGGPLPDSVAFFHKVKSGIPVMLIHGDADEIVRYAGKEGAYRSALETYNYWKIKNGLEGIPEKTRVIDRFRRDSTTVRIRETKARGQSVSLVSVEGGGHTWPGSHPFNIGFASGRTTPEVNANDLLWQFFAAHVK